jgi:5-(carboxyamino)imidazole ribonucleotide synthase
VHLYGKREARPGRKMGHLSADGDSAEQALTRVLDGYQALKR